MIYGQATWHIPVKGTVHILNSKLNTDLTSLEVSTESQKMLIREIAQKNDNVWNEVTEVMS